MAPQNLPETQKDPIYELLVQNKTAIESVLPKHLTVERILRLAYTAFSRSPKLRQCTPDSLINSVLELSMLGLEIGRTGHIVPFGKEAVFIPDYKGYIDLAHRSDRIESFPFKPVYANDEFDYQEGTTRYIKHVPCKTGDRGALVAAYAICFFKHGGYDFEVVWQPDIDATKRVSPGARHSDSPWNKADQEWTMWCKTAVRRLAKRIPQSPELQKAAYHEEMAEAGLKQDIHYLDAVIDVTSPPTFDEQTPDGTDQEALSSFLDLCAQQFNKSVQDVKTGAAKDPKFWAQFAKWQKARGQAQKITDKDTPEATGATEPETTTPDPLIARIKACQIKGGLKRGFVKLVNEIDWTNNTLGIDVLVAIQEKHLELYERKPFDLADPFKYIEKEPEEVHAIRPEEDEAKEQKTDYVTCPPDSKTNYAGKTISPMVVCSGCDKSGKCDPYLVYLDAQRGKAQDALE